ncbi:MAG: caspase family protein [Planctomycetes bacterium]|nr:caspase family protein [Planctomycetota bacterium]
MKQAVQITCPNCRNALRIPADMVEVALKCKFCGNILQISKRSSQPAAPPAPPPFTGFQAPTGPGYAQAPPMPEYSPPAYSAPMQQPLATQPIPHTSRAPRPLVEEVAAAPSDYNAAFDRAGRRHKGRGNYKGPRGNGAKLKWIAVGSILVLGMGVFAAVVAQPQWFRKITTQASTSNTDSNDKQNDGGGTGNTSKKNGSKNSGGVPKPEEKTGPMPRRMLAIGITNYLYSNTLQYGDTLIASESRRMDFFKSLDRLASGWRIPKDQVTYLTDGPVQDNKTDYQHPPLKMVVEGTLDNFLSSCRAQDRIVIVFAGHAIEKEGEAYLVPLEGEFEELGSLIPLKSFYEKIDKCVAQEKFVIFDVCRFDRNRGFERPAFGVMTEALEKALHSSPDGVSVMTSCSKDQYSFETEYAEIDRIEMRGSAFFALFATADDKGIFGKRQAGTQIHHPADPLPIKPLADFMESRLPPLIKDLEKLEQKPKLTYKAREDGPAYDPKEPLANKVVKATPPPTAKREEVVALFKEVSLPSLKSIRKDVEGRGLADSFPFTEEQLKDYFDNGPTFAQIEKEPKKFEAEYPLRVAAVQAIVDMRKLKNDDNKLALPEYFKSPVNDATKKKITDDYQREITDRQGTLEEHREKLASLEKKKPMEKSKRWLANYDYAYAQVRARLAYIFEYNLALGNVKLEKLPELEADKKQNGWKLASVEKMVSPKEIRDIAEEAKTAMSEIVKDYPNTPWAVMAKAQRHFAFGLQWQASSSE